MDKMIDFMNTKFGDKVVPNFLECCSVPAEQMEPAPAATGEVKFNIQANAIRTHAQVSCGKASAFFGVVRAGV